MEDQPTCSKCGGQLAPAETVSGSGPLLAIKQRSAISLGITRGSSLSLRVCTSCGFAEFYATNPEALR